MYSGSSDGEGPEAPTQRKIPPASSMLWVRNLRRFIGSGAGLGSEALMGQSFLTEFIHSRLPLHTAQIVWDQDVYLIVAVYNSGGQLCMFICKLQVFFWFSSVRLCGVNFNFTLLFPRVIHAV